MKITSGNEIMLLSQDPNAFEYAGMMLCYSICIGAWLTIWAIKIGHGFIRLLGQLTLFLVGYNKHRPDMPRSY